MNCSSTNGRVDILGNNIKMPFSLSDKIPLNDNSNFRDALIGNWNNTPLSDAFFSRKNIIILQNALRKGVFDMSKGAFIIGPQDTDELKIIMRAIFLENSINLPTNIPQQIDALNTIIIDYAVPQIYGEVQGYNKYIQDASTMYTPFPRIGSYSNSKDKTLELKRWF
jgi:hypothetical protein